MPHSKIMIIDESPEELHLFEEILSGEGYSTVTAASCTEALSNQDLGDLDMILLDEDTDEHDGHKINQLAARFCKNIPIILITHHEHAANQQEEKCVSGLISMPTDKNYITSLICDFIPSTYDPYTKYMHINPKF